jgi:hypothetical protein
MSTIAHGVFYLAIGLTGVSMLSGSGSHRAAADATPREIVVRVVQETVPAKPIATIRGAGVAHDAAPARKRHKRSKVRRPHSCCTCSC